MDNIFKDAYFGKAYKTRDDRKAVYLYQERICPFRHFISLGGVLNAPYDDDGHYSPQSELNDNCTIVSEWQEEPDEDELDRLAQKYIKNKKDPSMRIASYYGFRAGFREAVRILNKNGGFSRK